MPNAIALTSEYMPHRRRGTAVTTMICGFSLGAAVGGFVAACDHSSLRMAVGVRRGRSHAAADRAAAFLWLPESIRFLLVKGGRRGSSQELPRPHRTGRVSSAGAVCRS